MQRAYVAGSCVIHSVSEPGVNLDLHIYRQWCVLTVVISDSPLGPPFSSVFQTEGTWRQGLQHQLENSVGNSVKQDFSTSALLALWPG